MSVIDFPRRGGDWRADELRPLVSLAQAARLSWDTGTTERGEAQFYVLGPAPEHDCVLCVSRLAQGYVLQDGGLMPHWTVRRNVGLVPWLRDAPNAATLAADALTLVGFADRTFDDRYPRQLSGGQRQRVAMARALAAHPTVILLDEPFGALDAITRSDLQEMFAGIRKRRPVTALLVTHDLFEAQRLADRIAVMRAGRIEHIGTPREIRQAPATDYVARLVERAGLRRMEVAGR